MAMAQVLLKQIYTKLNELDRKVSALLVKEEPATKDELLAIRRGEKEFAQGKFKSLSQLKAKYKN